LILAGISILYAAIIWITPTLYYSMFQWDQARDGFVYAHMQEGNLPTLGPGSSFGGYSLPPTYYYLVFVFSWWTHHPAAQNILNFLATLATLPVFIFFVMRFTKGYISTRAALWIGAIAAFWLSCNSSMFSLTLGEWNPNPMPLLFLMTVLLADRALQPIADRKQRYLTWAAIGLVLGIDVGLHSAMLFVMPICFCLLVAYCVARQPRSWPALLTSIGVFLLVLSPYIVGELHSHLANTRHIAHAVFHSGGEPDTSLIGRIDRVSYFLRMTTQEFVLNAHGKHIDLAAVIAGLTLAAYPLLFVIHRRMAIILSIIWGIFFAIASNYTGDYHWHYMRLNMLLPLIVLTGVASYAIKRRPILIPLLALFVLYTASTNWSSAMAFTKAALSSSHLMTVGEKAAALKHIPEGSTICSNDGHGRSRLDYAYISQYLLRRSYTYTVTCEPGDYYIRPTVSAADDAPLTAAVAIDYETLEQQQSFAILRHR
jgi:hypothetical protein